MSDLWDLWDLWGQTVYYEKFVSLYVLLAFIKSIDKIKFYTKKLKYNFKKLNFNHEIDLLWPLKAFEVIHHLMKNFSIHDDRFHIKFL